MTEQEKLERKRKLAKARYERYMSNPDNRAKRLQYWKDVYRRKRATKAGQEGVAHGTNN